MFDARSGLAAWRWGGFVAVACLLLVGRAYAKEVLLKNGTVLQGSATPVQGFTVGPQKHAPPGPITVYPMLLVMSDIQRFFVPAKQVAGVDKDVDLGKFETFTLTQPKGRATKTIQLVGSYTAPEPFDQFGRRTVLLQTPGGEEKVIQGVVKITPQFLKIVGISHTWETGIPTTAVKPEVLDAMLRQATKADNPDHQLAIARFYLQAGLFDQAQKELGRIRERFTELVDTVDEAQVNLAQLQAQQFLDELKLRQRAGQHILVYEQARQFRLGKVSAALARSYREFITSYQAQKERADYALVFMGELQAALKPTTLAAEVAPIRREIAEKLNFENFTRLEAFLKLADAPKLAASEKLALALSGWLLGSANAITDLEQSLRLWKARGILRDYLRTRADGYADRQEFLSRLLEIEGVGVSQVVQMLPNLPPALDAGDYEPGVIAPVRVSSPKAKLEIAYSVLLPTEYNPDHHYPLIVALRGQGRTVRQEIDFWGGVPGSPGQSMRHGYIVIAPEYADATQKSYDYGVNAHQIVLESLYDARRRFNVDSDRVFLSGHDMGGDAAFDIGFSHPDLFAGVIPFGGISEKFCKFYWSNSKSLPYYIVSGELDGKSLAGNARDLNRIMLYGYDVIYTEFLGYGQDSFYAEIHKLFTWMDRLKRARHPKEIKFTTLRETDNRCHWLQISGLPKTVTDIDWADKAKKIKPMTVTAEATPGNTVHIACQADHVTLWLSPEVIDFDKRVSVKVKGNLRWNDFVKPDLGAMLEELRRHGDREELYWAVLEF